MEEPLSFSVVNPIAEEFLNNGGLDEVRGRCNDGPDSVNKLGELFIGDRGLGESGLWDSSDSQCSNLELEDDSSDTWMETNSISNYNLFEQER